jgi:hypothetical protein
LFWIVGGFNILEGDGRSSCVLGETLRDLACTARQEEEDEFEIKENRQRGPCNENAKKTD